MAERRVGLGIVKKEQDEVTVDKLKQLFPKKKATITQETADIINRAQRDPEFDGYSMLNNLVSLQSVMMKNSASMQEYVDAIKFCAYLETYDNQTEAYKKAFAHRDFVQDRMNAATGSDEYRHLTSAAARYKRNPLVVDILTQANVPLYLMFQGTTYEAVAVLADRMHHARLDKDKISAAKAILEHVKPPENIKIELDVGVKENDAIQQLNDQLAGLAASQKTHLESGSADLKKLGSIKPRKDTDEEVIDVVPEEPMEEPVTPQSNEEWSL